jgi:hypothetical protein
MKRALIFAKMEILPEHRKGEKEIRLWRAVLDQAIQDYQKDPVEPEDIRAKEEAQIWLRGNTEDFKEVCDMAMLNTRTVKAIIEYALGGKNLYD